MHADGQVGGFRDIGLFREPARQTACQQGNRCQTDQQYDNGSGIADSCGT